MLAPPATPGLTARELFLVGAPLVSAALTAAFVLSALKGRGHWVAVGVLAGSVVLGVSSAASAYYMTRVPRLSAST